MEHNPVFETAVGFINHTSRSVFLTGKAGTGKTTFLKFIREKTHKRTVVVAPTGVAAINAGGVTMHSFFQLPLGPFVPLTNRSQSGATDKFTLFKNMRVSDEKRQIFRDLELLIIDEVSMVRSDSLDAIDAILRYFRRRPQQAFGGVQVLFIGDLFQLPPVMPEAEWNILKDYYRSEFFFHSKVVEGSPPVYVELKKIYRQNEQSFISILNRIRNNQVDTADYEILNQRYKVSPKEGQKYITLTSHNYKADRINQDALRNLPGKTHTFDGVIEGEFQDKALPTDVKLELKEGAQIMFIRNDTSESRRYYNGKLATVSMINNEGVWVTLDGESEKLKLEKETWNNIKYSYNPVEEEIEEERLGSFSQYPIRLAWAITIHKSQGLTFEYAIIDAGESFAPGQVYVALSRCVSLDGIILHSRIESGSVSTHPQVLQFASNELDEKKLSEALQLEKEVYQHSKLLDSFSFQQLIDVCEGFVAYSSGKMSVTITDASAAAKLLIKHVRDLESVAMKFRSQVEQLIRQRDHERLEERMSKAIVYFKEMVGQQVIDYIDERKRSLEGKKKIKKYVNKMDEIRTMAIRKVMSLVESSYKGKRFYTGPEPTFEKQVPVKTKSTKVKTKAKDMEKGSSLAVTLHHWQTGLRAEAIARERKLALSTIEGHVALLIKSGLIDILEAIEERDFEEIKEVFQDDPGKTLSSIKETFGDRYTYSQLRAVQAYLSKDIK